MKTKLLTNKKLNEEVILSHWICTFLDKTILGPTFSYNSIYYVVLVKIFQDFKPELSTLSSLWEALPPARQGLDTFWKRGFVDNAFSRWARQRPHKCCNRKTRQIMKTTFGRRRPLVEDPSVEDNLRGRRPLVKDDFPRKTTFGGRWPTVEDDLWWKTTFGRRQPLVEDVLQWKINFSGRHLRRWILPLTVTA